MAKPIPSDLDIGRRTTPMGKKERPKETRNGYFFLDQDLSSPFFLAHPGAARHDMA
jgi:hypothetical protein